MWSSGLVWFCWLVGICVTFLFVYFNFKADVENRVNRHKYLVNVHRTRFEMNHKSGPNI